MIEKLMKERTLLIVVDVQEAFAKAVPDFERVAANVAVLVEAAKIMGVSTIYSEQYPKGLGKTVPTVAKALGNSPKVEKTCFSAMEDGAFKELVQASGRDQAILCGIESHVCVWQTAYDLIKSGLSVHVAADAVSSRTSENRRAGLRLMEKAGAQFTTVETALFELLGRAGTEEFKAVQRLVK